MFEVVGTDEFAAWYQGLDEAEAASVTEVVERLVDRGISLGAPYSSALQGARHALRELRPKQGRSPLRIVYVYDPRRDAVLLIGGDKAGDNRFYERIIPRAEAIFERYLAEQAAGGHED